MAAPTISWKRGQTFTAIGPYVPGAGDPVDLDGVVVTSEVLDNAGNRWPLTVTVGEDNLTVTLYASDSDTASWSVGTASIDLRCSQNGVVFATTTARFTVLPEITTANG